MRGSFADAHHFGADWTSACRLKIIKQSNVCIATRATSRQQAGKYERKYKVTFVTKCRQNQPINVLYRVGT